MLEADPPTDGFCLPVGDILSLPDDSTDAFMSPSRWQKPAARSAYESAFESGTRELLVQCPELIELLLGVYCGHAMTLCALLAMGFSKLALPDELPPQPVRNIKHMLPNRP